MSSFSALQPEQISFVNVSIKCNYDQDVSSGTLMTNVEFRGSAHQQDKRNWMLTVRVNIKRANEKPIPYEGVIECIGIFKVSPQCPEDQIEKLVMVNGTSLVYGSIREMICNITARSTFDMLMLPSQSFLEAFEKSKQPKPTAPAIG